MIKMQTISIQISYDDYSYAKKNNFSHRKIYSEGIRLLKESKTSIIQFEERFNKNIEHLERRYRDLLVNNVEIVKRLEHLEEASAV